MRPSSELLGFEKLIALPKNVTVTESPSVVVAWTSSP